MRLGTWHIVMPSGDRKDKAEDGVNSPWSDAETTVEARLGDASSGPISKALSLTVEIHTSAPEKAAEMKHRDGGCGLKVNNVTVRGMSGYMQRSVSSWRSLALRR